MDGDLTCEDSPDGGARFVLTVPLAPTERVVTTYVPLETLTPGGGCRGMCCWPKTTR